MKERSTHGYSRLKRISRTAESRDTTAFMNFPKKQTKSEAGTLADNRYKQ